MHTIKINEDEHLLFILLFYFLMTQFKLKNNNICNLAIFVGNITAVASKLIVII